MFSIHRGGKIEKVAEPAALNTSGLSENDISFAGKIGDMYYTVFGSSPSEVVLIQDKDSANIISMVADNLEIKPIAAKEEFTMLGDFIEDTNPILPIDDTTLAGDT